MANRRQHDPGYVYILANDSMPGLLKIGKTMHHPEGRARDLQSTGVATPFKVVYFIPTNQMSAVEQAVHQLLAQYRVSPRREFFRVDAQTAVNAVASYGGPTTRQGGGLSCFWVLILSGVVFLLVNVAVAIGIAAFMFATGR